ncbi:hypothetical protein [Roseixanthobacter pseudopolyaromaticivorans]|uniref:hypothetical protein n=1 Tax=Xanthobacteraceae TaxID=335928 RepID=UPI00372CC0BF
MNEVKNINYDYLLLAITSIFLFIFIVYSLTQFERRSNVRKIYRVIIGFFSVLFLVSLVIFQIGLIGAAVGGGLAAAYIIIATLFLEVTLGLALLIRAARLINLKYNSIHEEENFSSLKYNNLKKWVPLMFIAFSICFITLIFLLLLFNIG